VGLLASWFRCPLLTLAGRQLGAADARDLFPGPLLLVRELESAAMALEVRH
jgi:DNA (cytosine-5)-methyltransferase 1